MKTFRNYLHVQCFFMMVLLISISLVFIACPVDSPASENATVKDDGKDKEKEKPSPVIPDTGGGPSTVIKGAGNSSFIYSYYPTDKKIYYLSDNDIYTMSPDSASPIRIKDNTFAGDAKARYITVHKDKVYYDDGKNIYRIELDGSSPETFITDGHGMMKVYGDTFYYFVANKTNASKQDLMSIPLDKSASATTVVETVACYIDERKGGDFYVNTDNTIFYHNGSNGLWKKVASSEAVILSEGSNDNYVFAQDSIYFRDHAIEKDGKWKSFYGISKGAYNAVKEMPATIVRATDGAINERNALNVSSSWMVYYNGVRSSKPLVKTIDLRYVSLDGTAEKVLVSNITTGKFGDAGYKALVGEIKIIGDYAYYMQEESNTEYSLHRVKNDGTRQKELVTITI